MVWGGETLDTQLQIVEVKNRDCIVSSNDSSIGFLSLDGKVDRPDVCGSYMYVLYHFVYTVA